MMNSDDVETAVTCYHEIYNYLTEVLLSIPEDEWFTEEEQVMNCLNMLGKSLQRLKNEE